MYRALKRIKVGDGYRSPGEEVSEAESWRPRIIKSLIDLKRIEEVPGTKKKGQSKSKSSKRKEKSKG